MGAPADTEAPEAARQAGGALARRPAPADAEPAGEATPRPLRHRVRDVLASALWKARPSALLPAPATLTVVTFHRFLPASLRCRYPWPGLAVTPPALERMLRFFGTHFLVLPLSEALDALRAGDARRPLLAITIDDGQWDGFEYARPVFRRAGVRATFYVPTDAVDRQRLLWPDRLGYALARARETGIALDPLLEIAGVTSGAPGPLVEALKRLPPGEHRRALALVDGWLDGVAAPPWGRMMRWEEVAALAEEGHEIGGHSRSHPILPQLGDDALADEIAGCRQRLAEVLGERVAIRSFAYPNGDHDARARGLVARAGFENAVTTAPARTRAADDRFRIGRFDLQEEHTLGPSGRVEAAALAWRLRDPERSLLSLLGAAR